jgi:hypothetical protein
MEQELYPSLIGKTILVGKSADYDPSDQLSMPKMKHQVLRVQNFVLGTRSA